MNWFLIQYVLLYILVNLCVIVFIHDLRESKKKFAALEFGKRKKHKRFDWKEDEKTYAEELELIKKQSEPIKPYWYLSQPEEPLDLENPKVIEEPKLEGTPIKYETKFNKGLCYCPFGMKHFLVTTDIIIPVGSVFCQKCWDNVKTDKINQIVYCKHPNKTVKCDKSCSTSDNFSQIDTYTHQPTYSCTITDKTETTAVCAIIKDNNTIIKLFLDLQYKSSLQTARDSVKSLNLSEPDYEKIKDVLDDWFISKNCYFNFE